MRVYSEPIVVLHGHDADFRVEHAVTEVVRPGLDLVELLIRQGLSPDHSLPESELSQEKHAPFEGHSIEARVYCENPKQDFRPAPGRLQLVEWSDIGERGRIDTWVKVSFHRCTNVRCDKAKL